MPPQLDELLARVDQCSTQAIELSTHFQELREQIRQAIDIAQRDPEMSLIRSRRVLEYIVVDIYDESLKPKRAGTQPLEGLVQTLVREGQFPNRLAAYADMVRGLGNVGAHGREKGVSSQDVLNSLSNLLPIVEWYFERQKMPAVGPATAAALSADSGRGARLAPAGSVLEAATSPLGVGKPDDPSHVSQHHSKPPMEKSERPFAFCSSSPKSPVSIWGRRCLFAMAALTVVAVAAMVYSRLRRPVPFVGNKVEAKQSEVDALKNADSAPNK